MQILSDFITAAEGDARITTAHISVFTALWKLWKDRNFEKPLSFFSHELMPLCKISSYSTYHKTIRQLHEFGYIKYVPSYNHSLGSEVHFLVMHKSEV